MNQKTLLYLVVLAIVLGVSLYGLRKKLNAGMVIGCVLIFAAVAVYLITGNTNYSLPLIGIATVAAAVSVYQKITKQ